MFHVPLGQRAGSVRTAKRRRQLTDQLTDNTYQRSTGIVVTPRAEEMGFTPEMLAEIAQRQAERERMYIDVKARSAAQGKASYIDGEFAVYPCDYCGALTRIRPLATEEETRDALNDVVACCLPTRHDRAVLRAHRPEEKRRRRKLLRQMRRSRQVVETTEVLEEVLEEVVP